MHGLFRVRGFTQASLGGHESPTPSFWQDDASIHCLCPADNSRSTSPHWCSLSPLSLVPQDDAHIFCLPGQIEAEILGVLDLTEKLLSQFGFKDFEVSGWQ